MTRSPLICLFSLLTTAPTSAWTPLGRGSDGRFGPRRLRAKPNPTRLARTALSLTPCHPPAGLRSPFLRSASFCPAAALVKANRAGNGRKGKTTLLNALSNLISGHERILIIEDTAEIQIEAPNLVRFEARREQGGLPAVTIRELLKASLRHRPDRILLGEIRGAEAFDLLQLLNTGHAGTISTVHANSGAQALSRFTSCVLESGVELPYRAIKSNIGDSLNILVHLDRRSGRRFVSEVVELKGYNPDLDRYQLTSRFIRMEDNSCTR